MNATALQPTHPSACSLPGPRAARFLLTFLLGFCLAASAAPQVCAAEQLPAGPRVVFNDDAQVLSEAPPRGTAQFVRNWLAKEVAAVPFTTYVFLAATPDICTYDSRAGETFGDRFGEKFRDGWAAGIRGLRKEGTDVLKVVCDSMHSQKKEVLAAIRMSDTHHRELSADSPLCPRFALAHPEYVIKQPDGRTNETALDYSHAEVRSHRLAIMREIAEGYEVDGLELNFVRWAKHFPRDQGKQRAEVMTRYLGEIRDMLAAAARKRGRQRLTLGVRVPESLAACWLAGLDVEQWVRNKWIDYVVISTWNNTDPQIPVEEFARFTKPAGVDTIVVMGNMIGSVSSGPPSILDRPIAMSAKHRTDSYLGMLLTESEARGAAANYYSWGADSISFWNVGIHFGGEATAAPEQQARIARWTQAVRSPDAVWKGPRTYRYLPMGKGMASRKPPVRNYPWAEEGRSPTGHVTSPVVTFGGDQLNRRQAFPFRMADGRDGERLEGKLTFWIYHLVADVKVTLDLNGQPLAHRLVRRFPAGQRRGRLPGQRFEISLADCPPFRGLNELGIVVRSATALDPPPYLEELEVVVTSEHASRASHASRELEREQTDLLIVGGTESACAAAVQAARMGVPRITLVNDIDWLGGQFTAEGLLAFDENTDKTGIRHDPPIPRHGAFRELIERIEADNLRQYGVARPGNTRVITTCQPADAHRAFQQWLAPYVQRGQIVIHTWYEPTAVSVSGNRVDAVTFRHRRAGPALRVQAKLTIDASDWGDVIRLSGAEYEFGPDLKAKYDEPLAPLDRADYPLTDMNPITYCMVVEETDRYEPIPKPAGYDPRNYRTHRYPRDPLWLYGTRRLVDHYHFKQIDHPDVLLLCFPAFDYPLDTLPQRVADALEATEPGASRKNVVELSPRQRRIIFEDAKRYSLGFLYYLQTEVHEQMEDATHSFRRFQLTDQFGTADRLPPKPYVREALRLTAMYMMRQQDTLGVRGDSANYARAMYHDGVAVWQFEYDFHPTRREFLEANAPDGPWRNGFREGRTWGPPYSGRSLFPLRSLIPRRIDGLLGGQKNLGFSSIVSSAVRLHDQSMGIGQAAGACAAHCLNHQLQPREIPFDRRRLLELQQSIVTGFDGGQPGMVWPFRDLTSADSCYQAANLLAVQGCLPLHADEADFRPQDPATADWIAAVRQRSRDQLAEDAELPATPADAVTRGEFARQWWTRIARGPWKPYPAGEAGRAATPPEGAGSPVRDTDGDGIADHDDALPLDPHNQQLPQRPLPPAEDGEPGELPAGHVLVKQFNFGPREVELPPGYLGDFGQSFDKSRGYGWEQPIVAQNRRRNRAAVLADTFLFTRTHAAWQCALPDGKYTVELCVGDAAFEQAGQNVTVAGQAVIRDATTRPGRFAERTVEAIVAGGKLTVAIGLPGTTTNTCLNWLRISRKD